MTRRWWRSIRNGSYVTLRLTAAMYHRFHAPCDGTVEDVWFIPGDAWNVNPATLSRVGRVYCRNTRAVIPIHVAAASTRVTLVPVGAVLVSSIHLDFLTAPLLTAGRLACRVPLTRGQQLGRFEHGSTIVVLATAGLVRGHHVTEGASMRVGQMLWRRPTLRA